MIEINSTTNSQIKKFISIKEKKFRNEFGLALLEGEKVVLEALKLNKVKTLIVEKGKENFAHDFLGEVFVVPDFIIKKISSVSANQGVIGVIETSFVNEFKTNSGNFLVLDGVSDPGNLGSLIRSAVACGFKEIYAINCVDVFNDKVLRSASGTFFKINYYKTDYAGLEKLSKIKNNFIISADLSGENLFSFNLPKNKNIGIVLGNEGSGVSENAKKFIQKEITIPMQNQVESLNVAVSGSVIMFQISKGDLK